jgi:GTPase SAR1 family protein
MGICASDSPKGDADEEKRNKALSRQMRADADDLEAIIKLLLLGAGQSGKSTLFKQMISIYGDGFSVEERQGYKSIIHSNVLASIVVLVDQAKVYAAHDEKFHLDPEMEPLATMVREMKTDDELDIKLAEAIEQLWHNEAIQLTYERNAEYQLNESAKYYFDQVTSLAKEDYVPTEQDVLRSRSRTTGVIENAFTIDGNKFRMFDVGGQRSERKKWIHCFEKVTAVLFVAAISGYNQVLFEDAETNRMTEAIHLFEEICNSRWFKNSSMILFLNKKDLFQDKVLKVPITECQDLQDYDGPPHDANESAAFIQHVFESKNNAMEMAGGESLKDIYTHITCATDKNNVKCVFHSVKETILKNSLSSAGLV